MATVSPESSDDISEWLSKGGFAPLSADELRTVEDYAQKGWSFVLATANVPPGGETLIATAPLMVSFAAEGPRYAVWPDDDAEHEMFIALGQGFARRYAEIDGMRVEATEALRLSDTPKTAPISWPAEDTTPAVRAYETEDRQLIWQPCLMTILPEALCLTRLRGHPRCDGGVAEASFSLCSNPRNETMYYSAATRKDRMKVAFGWVFLPVLWFSYVALLGWCEGGSYYARTGLLVLAAAIAGILPVAYVFVSSPVLPTARCKRGLVSTNTELCPNIILRAIEETGNAEDAAKYVRHVFCEVAIFNCFTGQPMRERYAPGDFNVFVREDCAYVDLYNGFGMPVRFPLSGDTDVISAAPTIGANAMP